MKVTILLQKSLLIISIFYVAYSMSHPSSERHHTKKFKRRSTKPKRNSKDDCVLDFCEKSSEYPSIEVDKLLKENRLPQVYNFYLKQYEAPAAREALTQETGNMCHVFSRTLRPRTARSISREKEYIVQSQNASQSIYMEVCKKDKPKFTIDCLPNGHIANCVQQYRLIPLLTFDEKQKNIKSNQFKVPSGCSMEYTKIKLNIVH